MADFTDTVSIELQQSTKQTSTGIAKVVNDLKQLHNGMTVGMTGVRNLQKQFQELGVSLSNSKLKSSISSINSDILRYVTTSGQMITVNRKVKNGLDSYRVSLKNTNKELKNGTSLWSAFTQGVSGALVKMQILYNNISRLVNKTVDMIQGATAYEEALNLFTVSMGDQAEEAMAWVEKFSTALYLDPSNVMQYMGSLNSLIGGLGVGAEKSYLMSKNLTQLAYDLASFKNMKFEEAFTKLQSGISGEIEPLRNVGVALSQNTLQELANSLGIKQRVAEMSEAQKAQLRYVQILKSTTQWQGDMGRTLISPANALRVVKEQFTLLGRAIGKIFIPIVMKTIPYVIALTEILTDLANRLAAFLGYELTDIDYSSLGNISTGITDIGDAAEETTNKLNTMLAPFDELNVVQNKSKSAGNGLGGIGGDLGIDLPEYDALAGLTDEFKKNVDAAKQNLGDLLKIVLTFTAIFATWKVGTGVLKFAALFAKGGTLYTGFQVIKGVLITTLIPAIKAAGAAVIGFIGGLSAPVLAAIGVGLIALGGTIWGIQKASEKAIKPVKVLDKEISEVSKVKLEPLLKDMRTLDDTLVGLELNSIQIDDKTVSDIQSQLATIRKSIVKELDADKNDDLKNLQPLRKALGEEAFAELENDITTYYNNKVAKVTENENKINEIIATARGQEGGITKGQLEQIQALRDEMNQIGIQSMTENEEEYNKIMARLKTNAVATSVEQASEIIKNAKKTKEDTIIEAEAQYNGVVAQAKRMLEAGAISEEQYDSIVSAAKTTRDETITSANEQYDGIISATKEKLGENTKYIDIETGKVKSNWDVFCTNLGTAWSNFWTGFKDNWETGWGEIKKYFNEHIKKWFTKEHWVGIFNNAKEGVKSGINTLKEEFESFTAKIKTPHFKWVEGGVKAKGWMKDALEALNLPTSIPKLDVKWYAEGGFPKTGELFVAREAGAEMVGKIGNQTAVANNDQITTSITNALITALNSYGFGDNKPSTTIVNIGGKKVYEGVGDYVDSENDRYGTNYVHV